ncbi:ankyrin repeat-containing domain protein [Halteromyces radiatus]|uniref:ankyrin repeat-containing domain protein n=1 Tax=Halteromyces radiatus TaxID=101107 RepID=UPI00221FF7C3|nr:ankyrin repeat-containing domain protein [Halteromyces radiatus]KAI8099769.1 ankyrin repeat-containing domain protein [Halteromyces radiatus]
MLFDEREETLREVCALGNTKAVQHFIHGGVKINSQNKMNGWTALHWASHRGQEDIVRLLLSNGADPTIKTNKGQTALDLCSDRYPNILTMLESQQVERTSIGPEPSLPIVPAYMKEPDLEKSWLMPDEFSENKIDKVIRQETAKDMLKNEGDKKSTASPTSQTSKKEVLVYLKTRSDDSILGSVFLKNETMTTIIEQLKDVK